MYAVSRPKALDASKAALAQQMHATGESAGTRCDHSRGESCNGVSGTRRADKLDPVLATTLAKNPEERFPRCSDFARAPARARGDRLGAKPAPPVEVTRRIIEERKDGRTFQAIADGLMSDGVLTFRGK